MARIMKSDDYALGYDQGLSDGREDGYSEGWKDCSQTYEARLAQFMADITILNARISVLERTI